MNAQRVHVLTDILVGFESVLACFEKLTNMNVQRVQYLQVGFEPVLACFANRLVQDHSAINIQIILHTFAAYT